MCARVFKKKELKNVMKKRKKERDRSSETEKRKPKKAHDMFDWIYFLLNSTSTSESTVGNDPVGAVDMEELKYDFILDRVWEGSVPYVVAFVLTVLALLFLLSQLIKLNNKVFAFVLKWAMTLAKHLAGYIVASLIIRLFETTTIGDIRFEGFLNALYLTARAAFFFLFRR